VVRDFNVTGVAGSVIALVRRSGAGKTTVTDLVARFHDPSKGRILLNNMVSVTSACVNIAACWPSYTSRLLI
jgi:ABC-type multidrug transport system fused ATPase/permease subunit